MVSMISVLLLLCSRHQLTDIVIYIFFRIWIRPTPIDILFEENDDLVQNSYHENSIYEWNIDGASEKVIHDQLHRMIMYATVCKQNNNSDKDIANFITCDFTGILKGWWDHCITSEQKLEIFNAIKIRNNAPTQDAVYTLVMTILEHFTGGVTDHGEKNRT